MVEYCDDARGRVYLYTVGLSMAITYAYFPRGSHLSKSFEEWQNRWFTRVDVGEKLTCRLWHMFMGEDKERNILDAW